MLASFFGGMVGYSVLIPYTFGLFLKPLSAAFGWRRDQISVASGCVAVTVAVCSPVISRLFDRFGPRRMILPCLVAFGSGFATLAFLTPSLMHFDVSATAQTLNVPDATIGNSINNETIESLPMEGRNVPDLLSLQPGLSAGRCHCADGNVASQTNNPSVQ